MVYSALLLALFVVPEAGVMARTAPEPRAMARTTIEAGKPQTGLKIIPLHIETANVKRHAYRVELARTADQQSHGMMFRTQMPPGTGMLFPLSPQRSAGFWMENTLIPLDLLFIGSDGTIRNIAANAVPRSRAMLMSVGPVAAVLELPGGEAQRIGAKPGDKVTWNAGK